MKIDLLLKVMHKIKPFLTSNIELGVTISYPLFLNTTSKMLTMSYDVLFYGIHKHSLKNHMTLLTELFTFAARNKSVIFFFLIKK